MSPAPPPPPSIPTPEQVLAAGLVDGAAVQVQGTVLAVTFDNTYDNMKDPQNPYSPLGDRYVLLRNVTPPGVHPDADLRTDDDTMLAAWGLGLVFERAGLESGTLTLPQLGDQVVASGTLEHLTWNGHSRPVLTHLQSFTITGGKPPPSGAGQACSVDMDCADDLICLRATKSCGRPPAVTWGDAWRDVNGACDTDDDCPLGELCDQSYAISTTDAHPVYYLTSDAGRHLCVPDPKLTLAQLCPRTVTSADLAGGRFAPGKEICVTGEILIKGVAMDGDTHVQMKVDEPLVFPIGDAPYYVFGATNENAPPYKNEDRPDGALLDPAVQQRVVTLGTYRYDPSHGWFESHPLKAWWPAP